MNYKEISVTLILGIFLMSDKSKVHESLISGFTSTALNTLLIMAMSAFRSTKMASTWNSAKRMRPVQYMTRFSGGSERMSVPMSPNMDQKRVTPVYQMLWQQISKESFWFSFNSIQQGRIHYFHLRGGGAKDYVPARTLRARNRTHFRQGSRSRLRAMEALGLF